MLKNWRTALTGAALLAALTTAGGCKQAEGDRCQLDSDCDDGLYCCYLDSVKSKGICKTKDRCEATSVDSGPRDGGKPDQVVGKDTGAPDKAVSKDTAVPDKAAAADQTVTSPDSQVAADQKTAE